MRARVKALLRAPRKSGNILILHNGRSGSTLLGDMLDQHEDIFWDGETFEKLVHRKAKADGIHVGDLYGHYSLDDGVTEVERRMRQRAGGRIFGTEIQDYHIEMMGTTVPEYIERLKSLGFDTFVFLDRNYMRKVVSGLVAVERKSFHVANKEAVTRDKIKIDPQRGYIGHRFTSILETLDQYKRFKADMESALADDPVLYLTYEEHLRDDPRVASTLICEFMGLQPHTPQIKYGKTTAFPLQDIVENYDELTELILNSPYADHMREAY